MYMCSILYFMYFDCKVYYNDFDILYFIIECLWSVYVFFYIMEDKKYVWDFE